MARVEELELTLELVKSRAVSGILTLTGRTFILQIIALIATFLLTIFLDPSEYGVFFIVTAVVNFFAYFSDIGLAAALVQKKESLKKEDLETTFVVQQTLVLTLAVLVFLLSPIIGRWYHLSSQGVYLLWALGFSLILSSLKTIPSVILERRLDFGKLIIPQIVETLVFNIVVVVMAAKSFGVTSFTVAVLARGVVGLVVIYLIQPWRPGFSFSRSSFSRLMRFGLPYQANSFLAVIKDDGLTAFLGGILGASGMGFLGWAQKWAYAPLRFFMDQVIKVTFPAYSRMQENKEELSRAVTRSIFFVCLFVFPSLVFLVSLAPILTEIVPRYQKWQPALIALTLISLNTAWAAVTTPLTNLLNAIGKITITLRLMIMWTTLSWLIIPLLAISQGVNGASLGFSIVGASSIVAILVSKKYIDISLVESVFKPLASSVVVLIFLLLVKDKMVPSYPWFFALLFAGGIIYSVSTYIIVGPKILADVKKVIHALGKK